MQLRLEERLANFVSVYFSSPRTSSVFVGGSVVDVEVSRSA